MAKTAFVAWLLPNYPEECRSSTVKRAVRHLPMPTRVSPDGHGSLASTTSLRARILRLGAESRLMTDEQRPELVRLGPVVL